MSLIIDDYRFVIPCRIRMKDKHTRKGASLQQCDPSPVVHGVRGSLILSAAALSFLIGTPVE